MILPTFRRLTDEQAVQLRVLHAQGISQEKLTALFCISMGTVRRVILSCPPYDKKVDAIAAGEAEGHLQ
jgi:hypothetical protein